LDLNLPRLNGKEILQYLKYHPRLKVIPIVVLTTSEAESDIWESYTRYANAYIVKPADLDGFFQVIQMTLHYWCEMVTLPHLRNRPSL
jgi:CheY-like chemotaxis protein